MIWKAKIVLKKGIAQHKRVTKIDIVWFCLRVVQTSLILLFFVADFKKGILTMILKILGAVHSSLAKILRFNFVSTTLNVAMATA